MIKVRCLVPVCEVDGKDTSVDRPVLIVESHWNHDRRVVLTGSDGISITLYAPDLEAAIRNATHSARHA